MSLYKKAGQRDLDALMRAYQSSMKISVLALSVVAVIEIIIRSLYVSIWHVKKNMPDCKGSLQVFYHSGGTGDRKRQSESCYSW